MKLVVLYGLIIGVFLSFGSCRNTDDEFLPDDVLPTVPEGYVRMQITVPGLTPVSTYALSSVDETHVSTVDVLVFNSNSEYLCHAQGQTIATDNNDSNKKTFDVDLRAAGNITGAYVMVVANARDAVNTAVSTFVPSTTTKETVMQSMTFTSSGKWNTTGSSNFTPFPMWGMTASPVSLAGTNTISSISLIRSVARVDVGIKFPDSLIDGTEDAAGLGSTFTLEEVYLYNSLDKGSIAPYSGRYSGTTVTAPSVPTTPDPGINDSPVPSYLSSNGTVDGFDTDKRSCTGAIYMAEHAAGDRDALSTNPHLVIGGRYGSSTADITYYRLDFVSGSYPNQTFLPVLRNHRYRFNITKVDGPGYGSATAAAEERPVNLTYDLSATDESLTSYVYNGQYALGVSRDSYTLDSKSRSATLLVSTTYEKGYKAESDQGWLTIATAGKETTTANAPGSPTTLTFSVDTNTGGQRSGTITITSGRLTKEIFITQKNTADGFTVGTPSSSYSASGVTNASLSVTSSWSWSVNVKSDPNAIVTSFTRSGTGNGTFYFSLKANSLYYSPSATFTFFSPTNEFTPVVERIINQTASTAEYRPTAHGGWAGSNVYWDGNKLTFDDTGVDAHKHYQGVFFKWGGLVGIDPSGTTWIPASNMVYVPNWNSANPTASTWEAKTANSAGYTTWALIPYAGGTANLGDAPALAYLTNAGHDPANRKGDICRYLTETGAAPGSPTARWRLPIENEFSQGSYSMSGTFDTASSNTDATGKWQSSGMGGYTKTTGNFTSVFQPFFPPSGWRDPSAGSIAYLTHDGQYCSSSPRGANAYYLFFTPGNRVDLTGNAGRAERTYGLSVRCVKD
ncbi:MAG: FimB/Mfa2 family fimbrial subunit [Prevotella sp.]|jgi:hypothetical protein|nr:FimB/Mfa2 family fimbrial subunit [Prevotella sp.]